MEVTEQIILEAASAAALDTLVNAKLALQYLTNGLLIVTIDSTDKKVYSQIVFITKTV